MQLQHLTQTSFTSVVNACRIREAEYVVSPSGTIDRAPSSTKASHDQAQLGILNALNALSDEAIIELQALAWFGRGDSGSDLQTNLQRSKERFDSSSRRYLYEKGPLRQYIEAGLENSNSVLVL